MSKRFLSIGIDHGTTNSCIAVMEREGPRVLKPDPRYDVLPSVVYIDGQGRTRVGRPAREAIIDNKDGKLNGHKAYKPAIGEDGRYAFSAARRVMTAPELASIVLRELLRLYRQQLGEEPREAVIAVPAKFEDPACAGTRRAASLAGLRQAPLLQEPLAAALAYGFSTEDRKARWLILDLGGGTLDVSLVQVRKGQMEVPETGQAGDNRLGGTVFDRELMGFVLAELRKRYRLGGFSEKTHPQDWARLELEVEEAKIRLSKVRETVVTLEGILCRDEQGKPVQVEVPVTRKAYEQLISSYVHKAVFICEQLLKKNRLRPEALDRLILVGGPCKTPYIQEVFEDRLRIRPETTIDPMTVVALGAALYATTVERENCSRAPEASEGVQVRVEYERMSRIAAAEVHGAVSGDVAAHGLSVEIRRSDGGWTSGQLDLDGVGCFTAEVVLPVSARPTLTSFTTEVFDAAGRRLASVDEPEIWYPYPDVRPRLASSLLVALKDNTTETLLQQGVELPAVSKPRTFETAKELRQGDADDLLRIPVLEAVTHLLGEESAGADRHVRIGTLVIAGSDERVTMDLPRGTEVEVTIWHSVSRETKARAYVPLLEQEFEAHLTREPVPVEVDQLGARLADLKKALAEVEELERLSPLAEVAEALESLQRMQAVETAEREVDRARDGETGSPERAFRELLQLEGAVAQLRDIQRPERLARQLDELEPLARQEVDRDHLAELRQELAAARKAGRREALAPIEQALAELDYKLRGQAYQNLLLDLMALSGRRVTRQQNETFRRADRALEEVEEKGGIAALTYDDIQRLEALHRELATAHPELPTLRAETLARLQAEGRGFDDLNFGDLERHRTTLH